MYVPFEVYKNFNLLFMFPSLSLTNCEAKNWNNNNNNHIIFSTWQCHQWDHSWLCICMLYAYGWYIINSTYIKFWTHSSKSQLWHSLLLLTYSQRSHTVSIYIYLLTKSIYLSIYIYVCLQDLWMTSHMRYSKLKSN